MSEWELLLELTPYSCASAPDSPVPQEMSCCQTCWQTCCSWWWSMADLPAHIHRHLLHNGLEKKETVLLIRFVPFPRITLCYSYITLHCGFSFFLIIIVTFITTHRWQCIRIRASYFLSYRVLWGKLCSLLFNKTKDSIRDITVRERLHLEIAW